MPKILNPKKKINKKFKKPVVLPKKIPLSNADLTDEWMDAQDMKLLFKVKDSTLANWRKWSIIQGSKTGRGFLYNKGQIQAMLRNNLGKALLLFSFDFC